MNTSSLKFSFSVFKPHSQSRKCSFRGKSKNFWWGVGVGKSENYDSGSLFSTLELKKNPEIIRGDLTLNTSYRVIEFDLVVVKSWCWTRSRKKPLNQLLRTPLQTRDHPQKCSEAPGRLSNVFRCDRVHNDSTLRIKMSIGRSKFKATTLLNHWSQSSREKTDHNRKMKWKKSKDMEISWRGPKF